MRTGCHRQETGQLHRRGFTLAELLVVVSIICLLMSLSLPALTQAHRQAEQVHCLANQHQLTLAWLLHAPDHDDRLCPPDSWTADLKPYLQSEGVLLCKTDDEGTQTNSYGLSNTMGGVERDGIHWKDDRTRKLIQGRIADSEAGSLNNPDLEYMIDVLTVHRAPDPNALGFPVRTAENGD